MQKIFREVIRNGDSYVFYADTPEEDAREYWFGQGVRSFVAEDSSGILGMYKLIQNQRDRGSHVANASFMIHQKHRARGLGTLLGKHSLAEAKKSGFLAMQFNFVISANIPAVRLWEKLGFFIAGTLPKAFRHEKLGLTDVYVMYRLLDDI
ncbi:GNAT family N-acetyltransferase [Brucepastera parasyntrophica]|uniref:GNAT family N-acetyltransferase n=1 Tax=Brucepastera parasyntrophica TaxID=2880008 RepID=UPI00210928DD|nr:GNAT family N-acetyltransferase [Brucepastera parasyntrophica]ULQ59552.1 GNAT family N-acetyltransferase [Brucepastera parasyntrophica]